MVHFRVRRVCSVLCVLLIIVMINYSVNKCSNRYGSNHSVDFDIEYVEKNLESLNSLDPQLIQYVRVRHLTPPSKLPYKLYNSRYYYKNYFSRSVANFFGNKTNGTFIEAGAHRGEIESHTLYLEKELGWTGLLVECNPTVLPFLKAKHRKAWIADVCLSPTPNAAYFTNFTNPVNWDFSGTLGRAAPQFIPAKTKWIDLDVQAIPFYTILAALGWKEVDYFSFDIEGLELAVLKNFPFHLFKFKLMIVEVLYYDKEKRKELTDLLASNGYIFVKLKIRDLVYVHEDFKDMVPSMSNF